jgi:hypothetical protein
MIQKQIFSVLVDLKRKFIEQLTPEDMPNYNGKSFTRKSPLTLQRLLTIILRCSPFGLQIAIDDYYEEIGKKEDTVTKQAFSTARANLDPLLVRESFNLTAHTLSSCEDLKLFRDKYRVTAIDGSIMTLDNNVELLTYFGGSGQNYDCVSALASTCYDVLNDIILDGNLYAYGTSEREAAREHFKQVETLPLPEGVENLYVKDRGYISKELMADMMDEGLSFLMRAREKFNLDVDNAKDNETITFVHDGKKYQVRVFKIMLSSGEEETLVTNLPEEDMTSCEAGEVYFGRWKIETKYDSLKNKLELENMSGRSVISTYQDFWAKLDLANMTAALKYSTNEVIEENDKHKSNKYQQTTNESRLITKFTKRYIEILCTLDIDERLALYDELVQDIARRPVEVKPHRKHNRKKPRKKKFSDKHRRSLT